jgi:hypothetical protein
MDFEALCHRLLSPWTLLALTWVAFTFTVAVCLYQGWVIEDQHRAIEFLRFACNYVR